MGGGVQHGGRDPCSTTTCSRCAPAREPRICLLPTAGGDSEEQIRRFTIAFGDRLCEPSVVSLFRLGSSR